MPTHDLFHDAVKHGLTKDGWTITHDPLIIEFSGRPIPRSSCSRSRKSRSSAIRFISSSMILRRRPLSNG